MVVIVGDEEIAGDVNGKRAGAIKTRLVVGAVGGTERASQAGQSAHDPIRARGSKLADRMAEQVGDVNIPRSVHGHPGRPVEPRIAARAIVRSTKPRHTRDGGEGISLPCPIDRRSRQQAAKEQDARNKRFHVKQFPPA